MFETVKVLLFAPEGLLSETIAESLSGEDYSVTSANSLDEISNCSSKFDVGIYISSNRQSLTAQPDLEFFDHVQVANWLVLSENREDPVYLRLAQGQGVVCAVPLNISRQELPHLVELARRGRRLCLQGHCGSCSPSLTRSIAWARLSSRQLQLMRYLSEGLSNKEIARMEGCTEASVKVRMRTLLERIHASNRTQAAAMAGRAGLTCDLPRPGPSPLYAIS